MKLPSEGQSHLDKKIKHNPNLDDVSPMLRFIFLLLFIPTVLSAEGLREEGNLVEGKHVKEGHNQNSSHYP